MKIEVDDLLNLTAIAKRLGLSPATIGTYALRGQMPEPDAVISGVKFWREATIREWRSSQSRATTTLS